MLEEKRVYFSVHIFDGRKFVFYSYDKGMEIGTPRFIRGHLLDLKKQGYEFIPTIVKNGKLVPLTLNDESDKERVSLLEKLSLEKIAH